MGTWQFFSHKPPEHVQTSDLIHICFFGTFFLNKMGFNQKLNKLGTFFWLILLKRNAYMVNFPGLKSPIQVHILDFQMVLYSW